MNCCFKYVIIATKITLASQRSHESSFQVGPERNCDE
jgi:hypothetical protein